MMRKASYILFVLGLLALGVRAQVTNNGLPLGITQDLMVSVQGKFTSTGDISNDGKIEFYDSVSFQGAYSGGGDILLKGSDQLVDLQGATIQHCFVEGGNKELASDLSADTLTFSNAKIFTNGSIVEVSGEMLGYDQNSFVEGRLIRTGNDTLFYPVGKDGIYAPVVLNAITGTSPWIGVESFEQDPAGQAGYGVQRVDATRYWDITQSAGTFTGAQVELPLRNVDLAPNVADLIVVRGTVGGAFSSLGQQRVTGDLVSGSLTATTASGSGTYALGTFFDETLRVADSLALVSIYQGTNGATWTNSSGWLTGNLDSWNGVTVLDKRVVSIDLPNNNLTDNFPDVTSGLDSLSSMNLSSNALDTIGDLSVLPSLGNLNVSNNLLEFGTLENLVGYMPGATYTPQKEMLQRVRVVQEIGSNYTVDRTLTGTANAYAWTKNGVATAETNSSFDISVNDFTVDGTYVTRVTNSNVPGLTLTAAPVILRVSSLERDSTSLRAVYDSLITAQSSVSDWTSLPMSQWSEVTITGNRVVAVNLSGQSLAGSLPEDIVDLKEVTSIDLSDNNIRDLPEMDGFLPNITSFDVSGNKLHFDDLENNMSVNNLIYTDQQQLSNPFSLVVPNGQDFDLSVLVGGSGNEYQWSHTNVDSSQVDQPVAGASDSYTIAAINYDNMGKYLVRVTNPLVPGLILESHPMEVLASADLQFVGFGLDSALITEGFGYALKVTEPGMPFDSVAVVEPAGGIFTFDDLILGDYLIAFESDTSVYLPTYFRNTDLWTEADTLRLRTDRSDTLQMAVKPGLLTPADGDGVVYGFVESNFGAAEAGSRVNARRKVKRAGCSLRRRTRGVGGRTDQEEDEYTLVAYVESNEEGQFEFDNIPSGYYRFNIEYPGIPMDTSSFVEFEIGADGIENNTFVLEAFVTETGIEVIKVDELGFRRKYFDDLQVYPNPADREVNIAYSKLISGNVIMRFMDISGNMILEKAIPPGYNLNEQIDTSRLPEGLYLLHFEDRSGGRQRVASYKVFVSH